VFGFVEIFPTLEAFGHNMLQWEELRPEAALSLVAGKCSGEEPRPEAPFSLVAVECRGRSRGSFRPPNWFRAATDGMGMEASSQNFLSYWRGEDFQCLGFTHFFTCASIYYVFKTQIRVLWISRIYNC
jgi:hypothetical protein